MNIDDHHYTSMRTEVECGVLQRDDFRDMLETLAGEFNGYPLQVCYDEKPVHKGLYSKFIIQVKGKPDQVEDMAYELDERCRYFSMCLHEKLQIN